MKNRTWFAALALTLFAGGALAQGGTSLGWGQKNQQPSSFTSPSVPQVKVAIVGGINPADTSGVPLSMSSSGNLNITEAFPAMDANLTFASIISNSGLATATGDSSAILDTHRMRLGMLLFKVTPATGTGVITRLAVQVRVHLNGSSDSSSTFPIYLNFGKDQPVLASAAIDTANGGHQFTGSATAPWSGEFVVTGATARNSPGNAVAATAWSYPNGIAVPLNNIFGREVYAPYISVRVRNIVGPTCAVTVHLVGTPL